jgi:hypothetical protein
LYSIAPIGKGFIFYRSADTSTSRISELVRKKEKSIAPYCYAGGPAKNTETESNGPNNRFQYLPDSYRTACLNHDNHAGINGFIFYRSGDKSTTGTALYFGSLDRVRFLGSRFPKSSVRNIDLFQAPDSFFLVPFGSRIQVVGGSRIQFVFGSRIQFVFGSRIQFVFWIPNSVCFWIPFLDPEFSLFLDPVFGSRIQFVFLDPELIPNSKKILESRIQIFFSGIPN